MNDKIIDLNTYYAIIKKDLLMIFNKDTDKLSLKYIFNKNTDTSFFLTTTKRFIPKEIENKILKGIEKKLNLELKKINEIKQSVKVFLEERIRKNEIEISKELFNKFIDIQFLNETDIQITNLNDIYISFYKMYIDSTTKLLNNSAFKTTIGLRKEDFSKLYDDNHVILNKFHIKNGNFIISIDINNLKYMNDNFSLKNL